MAELTAVQRPAPVPYASAQPFWDAASEGRLCFQRCANDHRQHYPRPHCATCGSRALEWVTASGSGHVHTFSVVHRAGHDGFVDRVPYVFAIVDLVEGPRLTADLVDVDPSQVRVGLPVQAVFSDHDLGVTLPQFTAAEPAR